MRVFLIPLFAVLVLVPAGRADGPGLGVGERGSVSFPNVSAAAGYRVTAFSLTLVQAHVEGVSQIPLGWSVDVQVEPPVGKGDSWQTTVSGWCSRGKSLESASDLPSITFQVLDLADTGSPFQVEAMVEMTNEVCWIMRRKLRSSDLILRKY